MSARNDARWENKSSVSQSGRCYGGRALKRRKFLFPLLPPRRASLMPAGFLQLFWAMVIEGLNTSTADNKTYYCISKEGANEVHPVDATWLCEKQQKPRQHPLDYNGDEYQRDT